ncbi:MAG: hypothetical protein ACQETE_01575 [Bacteroidota bacterium]
MGFSNKLLEEASYYTPSETVDIASGSSYTMKFSGRKGYRFGVNRILPGGTNLNEVTAIVRNNNGRDTVIPEVQLAALRQLFRARSLRGAIIVESGSEIEIELKNNGAGTNKVSIMLNGYDGPHLEEKIRPYREAGLDYPQPQFLTANVALSTGTSEQREAISLPSYPVRMYRMALVSEDETEVRVSMRQDKTRIKDNVYASQINDEFEDMDIILPQTLQAAVPFDLFLSNDGAQTRNVSYLAEAYRIQD